MFKSTKMFEKDKFIAINLAFGKGEVFLNTEAIFYACEWFDDQSGGIERCVIHPQTATGDGYGSYLITDGNFADFVARKVPGLVLLDGFVTAREIDLKRQALVRPANVNQIRPNPSGCKIYFSNGSTGIVIADSVENVVKKLQKGR